MNDLATIGAPVSADSLLGTAAEMPTPTPGITAPTTGENAPAPAADQPAPGIADRKGNRHDPLYHEVPARLNAEGLWAKRRGNAIRKAKGLPPSGKTFGGAGFQAAPPKPDQAAPAPAAPPAGASTPPPLDALAGAPTPPPVVDGVPAPEMMGQPLEAYEATAGGWVDGTLGIAQMSLGPAWEPKPQERTVLVRAVQRVLHHYQLPILGPVLELLLVVIGFAAKRKDDPTTRTRVVALWDWATRKPKPVAASYTRSGDQAAPPAPPAAPVVDAYTVTGGDPAPPSQAGRVAWG